MAYTINFTDNVKTPITVNNGTLDTSTNIGLIGQGFTGYGAVMAENMLHIFENSASPTAPTRPVEGQLWYDNANKLLKYFDNTVAAGGQWVPITSMTASNTQPTGPSIQAGQFWFDNVLQNLYIYSGTAWQLISSSGGTRVVARTRYDTSDVLHDVVETYVGNVTVSITSAGSAAWVPQTAGANVEYLGSTGTTLMTTLFPTISPGINMNNGAAYVFNGTSTSSLYADLAERYEADAPMDKGTVVILGGVKEVTQSFRQADTNVFGVVSSTPGLMMNSQAGPDSTYPYIALAGRVPVKAIGIINKGDRVATSSTSGHVEQIKPGVNPDWRIVVGRALTDKSTSGSGLVEIVVGAK
jgi:hypothetical protein